MATRHLLSSACAIALLSTSQLEAANTLELALVIDGSGSISAGDWALQTGAYQSIFQDSFYTNFIQPSPFDDLVVGAFVFSGAPSGTRMTTRSRPLPSPASSIGR